MSSALATSHALVIGISDYARVGKLPRTFDAEDVAALLVDPARGGYAPANVTLLTEAAATRDDILTALDALATRAATSTRVLVYFSGHGGSTRRECYLMPIDGGWGSDDELAVTAIASDELNRRLRRITADQVTIVLDCCRAAGLADARGDQVRNVDAGDSALSATLLDGRLGKLAATKGRSVLAAARAVDSAYVAPGARNGVFTRHLLDGLRGAAHRTSGVIRVFDLYDHVRERVVAELPAQRPVFKAELEENYVLARCPGAAPAPLPPPSGDFEWDAFLSHDPAQRAWVDAVLRPRLEGLGLRLSSERTFRIGHAWVDEAARAAERSRYTVAVITPEYLARGFQQYEAVLGRHLSAEEGRPRFVPVLRGADALPPLGIRVTTALDLTREADVDAGLDRLALALRAPL